MVDESSWHGWYLFDEGGHDDLYERCRHLRETDPVNETPLGLWRLARYSDCLRLLREVSAGMRASSGESYSP